jgi:hypothetical protein
VRRLISGTPFPGVLMRSLSALALVSALTNAAIAEEACTMEHATYTDGEKGYELTFRTGKGWEWVGMTSNIYELTMPDGRVLWGSIASNMGTSRDIGSLYYGCERPGPEDPDLTEAQVAECRMWHNNIYALADNKIGYVPAQNEPAPESLVLADLGRTLRYTVLRDPGDEPWDQFYLKGV